MIYDQIILLAKNKDGNTISACKYGKVWMYIYENKKEPINSGKIGNVFDSKYQILEHSKNYILNECGYNFTKDHLQLINNKTMVFLSEDQKVAINIAIRILENNNSDFADQACYHLKTILN